MGDVLSRHCRVCHVVSQVGQVGVADIPIGRCPQCGAEYGPLVLGLDSSSAVVDGMERVRQRDREREFNRSMDELVKPKWRVIESDGDPT